MVITSNAIVAAIYGQDTGGDVDTTPVANVPVKFDVADKSVTGGYLIPSELNSPPVVDSKNNEIEDTDVPAATRTLYVRTATTNPNAAAVGFQFGTAAGKSEVTVSISGRGVSISRKVELKVAGVATTQLSISSNTGVSGDSKRFRLIARVARDGEALRGLEVRFQTQFGT